ncbi:ATP-grasp domain-containing protein [Epibacterium sp. SM1969]|uniref:ATP-grasp domain-containing protein n=1 Tax=Tritonibacter aquimaris TaxID=2663379 RepID=A0A844AP36_9RHOB|nr:acetyl/propionyl/methylcrotonyl-CoA carboxylase subunit alpha [Tritonibacter aquimaris]MQY41087.1 ATP-grasp domain-containing protein [Tritonibacter aquimaris]
MFDKILIANRGEIACRIMETAQRLGVSCVAVYSDADANARHVALADEAYHIGGAAPAESYLQGARLIEVALKSGAQAIHPGYGFLSENPDFVDAVEAAGLVFIGPSAAAIRTMGLKDAAKVEMEHAGVPVVPGYHGSDQAPDLLLREAARIGYPVLIKAVAGGGGKGMRLVEQENDFLDALESAQREATTAFGNPAVLIEKYITSPRHIEVQVFGDGTRAVHLFERDCSLQRRHQKVIEEAPAPGMSTEMRAAMGEAAVKAAEAISYSGAGTIEFIVDGSNGLHPDGFWFMEMNTRLQVEHPVTEEITGVDLVEWMLRVASGEPLPAQQSDLTISGHAFEARLYAEDVPAGFLPATGHLSHVSFPDHGARIDTGVRTGDDISPWYDPMVAKITVHGPTRTAALNQLQRALQNTNIAGTITNLEFLSALAAHQGFGAGDVDTGLIDRDLAALTKQVAPTAVSLIAAGQAALGLGGHVDAQMGFSLWAPLRQNVTLLSGEDEITLAVEVLGPDHQRWQVAQDTVEITRHGDIWRAAGLALPDVHLAKDGQISVFDAAITHVFSQSDPLARGGDDVDQGDQIIAPMPGLIKAVFVEAGQQVAQGDRLVVLEAMKMEHTLVAGRDGQVEEVLAAVDDQVLVGAPLIKLLDEE